MTKAEISRIFEVAEKIFYDDELEWEDKYDLIFSEQISRKVRHLFDWYDPDTTYEEDVSAFFWAFKTYVEDGGADRESKKDYYRKLLEE